MTTSAPLLCVPCKRTQIVPDVHFAAERAHLDDGLAQEVVRLALEMLLHPRLDVVVLVPHAHLDAVGGVVALAAWAQAEESESEQNEVLLKLMMRHQVWNVRNGILGVYLRQGDAL